MPKVSYHKEANIRRVMRDAMAVDPLISLRNLRDVIERKLARPIHLDYLNKLVKSVSKEMAVVADREKIEERIEYLRETNRIVRDELFRIAFPPSTLSPMQMPKASERLRALELLSKMDRAQVAIEMDLGLFTRHLGEIEVNHRLKPVDDITRSNIINAMAMWKGQAPVSRKIAPQAIIPAESKTISNEPTTKQPTPVTPPTGAQRITPVTGGGLVVSE